MFCGKVKEFLSESKVGFIERNIAADETALKELEKLGYMTTPMTVIDGGVVRVTLPTRRFPGENYRRNANARRVRYTLRQSRSLLEDTHRRTRPALVNQYKLFR